MEAGNGALSVDSMKEVYYDEDIQQTERGIRLTIRAFEAVDDLVLGKFSLPQSSKSTCWRTLKYFKKRSIKTI